MATAVYVLCAVTSVACAYLLLRGYSRTGAKLLFWSSMCFFGLAANNLLLLVDVQTPGFDMLLIRKTPAVIGVLLLIHGLVADTR